MEVNIVKELSTLTTIKDTQLIKLFDKMLWCISDAIAQAAATGKSEVKVDIVIGEVTIIIEENKIRYRFTPSKKFDKMAISAVVNEESMLVDEIEKTLANRIVNVYKEMF